MPYDTRFALRKVPINQNTWTDLVGAAILPIACNNVIVYNNTGQDILLRSDPGNDQSEVLVPNGSQFEIGASVNISGGHRFPLNCPAVASLLSSSGNVSLLVESI